MNAARRAPRGIDPRIDWVLAPVDVLSFALAVLGGDLLVAAVSGTPVSRLVPDWGSPFGKIQIFFYLFSSLHQRLI